MKLDDLEQHDARRGITRAFRLDHLNDSRMVEQHEKRLTIHREFWLARLSTARQRHAAGLLTDAEFASHEAEILGRLGERRP